MSIRNNSLSIVVFVLFFLFWGAQTVTGHREHNHEQLEKGLPELTFSEYLKSGHFIEATAENWESEFLQMAAYVLLTAVLFQKGSAESRKLSESESFDRDPRRARHKKDVPWPVRRGGWVLRLYENSLSLTFLLLFLFSFVMHAVGGAREEGQALREYVGSARFWFESFQNWQSEFLALGAMVVLSIFLRQRGSPESKPVDAPHSQTGE
jgi:hypothetical protein